MKRYSLMLLVALGLVNNPTLAHTEGPHVHGVATMQVAIEKNELNIMFSSPLDNLIGFEHQPHDTKQRKVVDETVKILNSPEKIFLFTANAKCKLTSTKITSPVIDAKQNKANDSAHMDLDAEYRFACENMAVKDLRVNLFTYFPNIKRIDYQMIGPKGQTAKQLLPSDNYVAW